MPSRPPLPIDEVLGAALHHLAAPGANAVVLAPPGAGKTTALPLAALEALPEGEIWVAQPRRLAARMAAALAARFDGSKLGERVGYRVRHDARVSAHTRLCYLTDGMLLRRMRGDPELRGVAMVVLDEFHERKLDADLALALLRAQQSRGREDLRIVVMSATLDPGPVAEFLGAASFASEGRAHPVELEYAPLRERRLEAGVLRALSSRVEAAQEASGALDVAGLGHVLVFLPGASEISRCHEKLAPYCAHHGLDLFTLHGELDKSRQDAAVAPSDRPKVILSTNVAETSVTIDDVATVIDAGLARVARHDPFTGLAQLELRPISRASAEQRAGRAGRTRPGHCVRLYARADFERRSPREAPEVARSELAEALFELAAFEAGDPGTFRWFEAPPEAALERAQTLLRGLAAIDEAHALTDLGRQMQPWPLHPRLAQVMARAPAEGCAELAAGVCAVLAERSLRRSDRPAPRPDDADPLFELGLLGLEGKGRRPPRGGDASFDPRVAQAVRQGRGALLDRLRKRGAELRPGKDPRRALRALLADAFFDKVAKVRGEGDRLEAQFLDGRAIPLAPACVVREDRWLVALRAQVRQSGTHRREEIGAACAVEVDHLLESRLEEIEELVDYRFDAQSQRVQAHARLMLGALEIEASRVAGDPESIAACLREGLRSLGVDKLVDREALEALRARLGFAHDAGFGLPEDFELDAALAQIVDAACTGCDRLSQVREQDPLSLLRVQIESEAGARLDDFAPASITLPGGRRLRVDYALGRPPSVASFLQDFFGSSRGPTIGGGRVPLVLHLRAPNRRDVQVTTDLAGFWERHYPTLRKQLMRRYPKHDWPEDPVTAKPPAPRPRGRRRR